MAKLYPPNIKGTIPAFYKEGTTYKIVVPFSMNRAVSDADIGGFALKIKNISGIVKGIYLSGTQNMELGTSGSQIIFNIPDTAEGLFLIGQYYKLQLAYIDINGIYGYYSTVGVAKCTAKPSVYIEGLEFGQPNTHNYTYVGVYTQKRLDGSVGDSTEKLYSYRFVLTDSDNNIIADSGEKLHNSSTNNLPYEAHDVFIVNQDLSYDTSYYITFIATTNNGLTLASNDYRVVQRRSLMPEVKTSLVAGMNYDDGYIKLSLYDPDDKVISGSFLISRASSKDNFNWEEIRRFDLISVVPSTWSYKDCTVEQGISYKYSLQQYNSNGIYSDRIISNEIEVDFEDMFLYDGERQLKIRFNPKVSTFKKDLQEQKVETIGSKYPFITRNGNISYKEFALSGLISYQADEAEMFMTLDDLGLEDFRLNSSPFGRYQTHNLVGYNIAAERLFKTEVLEWLTNGKVKLFRSPTEGNYIVRLMNVSLSPSDQIGRMLHTFNATAYEIADFNNDNLSYYNLIDLKEQGRTQTRWISVDIQEEVQKLIDAKMAANSNMTAAQALQSLIGQPIELLTRAAKSIQFVDMIPGAQVILDNSSDTTQIGITGAYQYDLPPGSAMTSCQYIISTINQGILTYSYEAMAASIFGLMNDIEIRDVPVRQFIGTQYQISEYIKDNNLLKVLEDPATSLLKVISFRAEKRAEETLFFNPAIDGEINPEEPFTYNSFNGLYRDMDCTERFTVEDFDELTIYHLREKANTSPYNGIRNYKYYVDANVDTFAPLTNMYIDGSTLTGGIYDNSIFDLILNDESINLKETEVYELKDPSWIESIQFNNGIVFNICYSKQEKSFILEDTSHQQLYPELYEAKMKYLNKLYNYIRKRYAADGTLLSTPLSYKRTITKSEIAQVKTAYHEYLTKLDEALQEYKEANGLVE